MGAFCMISRNYDNGIPTGEKPTPETVIKAAKQTAGAFSTAWLCYLEEDGGELMARIFAARQTKKNGLELLEVMREKPGHNTILVRALYYSMGWHVIFENELESWQSLPASQRPHTYIELINPEAVTTCETFKYCGWKPGSSIPLIDYLNAYLENNGVEYFGKLDLKPKKSLLRQAEKDGNFRKWLRTRSAAEIREANLYGPAATLEAYRTGKTIPKASDDITEHLRTCAYARSYAAPLMKRYKAERIKAYLDELGQALTKYQYRDYLEACAYLGLDFKDTKIAFPRKSNLKRLHDQRAQEMERKKIEEDKKQRAEFYENFRQAAQSLQRFGFTGAGFCIRIPKEVEDLKAEGRALSHCVGRMSYDQKMIEGRSFIAFLRLKTDQGKPYVTLEYDLKTRKLAQAYGAHDSKPNTEAQKFAEEWAQMVTEQLAREDHKQEGAA